MIDREFVETSERYGGTMRKVARVECQQCHVSTSVGLATTTGFLPPHAIMKKLEQKGWMIGRRQGDDLCPGCANAKQGKQKAMSNVVKPAIFSAASLEPPREMTRDDRRIIISKLDAVYLDSKRGYDAGWSDHKVASDLGVPRKWVETIRAENFGDSGGNEEMAEFYAQAKALLAETHKAIQDFTAEANRHTEASGRYFSELKDRLGKVEKMAESVKKYVAG